MSLVQNSRLERVSTRSLLNGLSRYRGAAPALLLLLGLLGTGQITALALIPSVLLLLCLWGGKLFTRFAKINCAAAKRGYLFALLGIF